MKNGGHVTSLVRTLAHKDIELFAIASGDVNPAEVDDEFAKSDMFYNVVAHGMWSGAGARQSWGPRCPVRI